MKIFRKLVLIWMFAWLPAAGALAAVMPLSASMAAPSVANAASSSDLVMATMPCHGQSASGKMAFGQGCSHCVLCHLAGLLVTPEMPVIAMIAPTHIFVTSPLAIHPSFVPELTAPPPRPSLA